MQLYPGETATKAADNLAEFFNSISNEYEPLKIEEVPTTHNRELPVLSVEDVAQRMKKSKKPTSTVPGDIPSTLYNLYPEEIAKPVTHIFKLITTQKE